MGSFLMHVYTGLEYCGGGLRKPFTGKAFRSFDVQFIRQMPDWTAGFAVYIAVAITGHIMKILTQRFQELTDQLKQVEGTETQKYEEFNHSSHQHIGEGLILNWAVKARNLIASACGKDSEHYVSFLEAEKPQSYEDSPTRLKRMRAVFFAAREDFEGGYLTAIRNLVHAELAGDELDQARELLAPGYSAAAAVVAGVVLETTLRTLCVNRGLPPGGMDRMNADLAKAGEYNALVQKRITSLAAIRNSAAHGKTGEYTVDDVKSMIPEVERFVAERLG
jgi:hypothetical protein